MTQTISRIFGTYLFGSNPFFGSARRWQAAALCGAVLGAALAVQGTPAQAQSRVPWYQPFGTASIWNTPIGTGATYSGPLGIGGGGDFADVDVEYQLRALPTDPKAVYGSYNGNPLSFLFPYYALPNKGVGQFPNGTTSLLFFSTDVNDYVFNQWQYWSRSGYGADLTNVGNVQYGNYFGDFNDLRPTSSGESATSGGTAFGTHGGSELSAVGGDLRVGEATSPDPIRHALKLNIDAHYLYPNTPNHASGDRAGNGYRWPAYKADSDPPPYSGTNADLAQGSLLAIPPSVNINNLGLQTDFGKKIAWTLQNFGAYIVDNSGYIGDQLSMEQNVREEIEGSYGNAPYFASSVSSDLITLYQQLRVVTNNGSGSIGGGGTPLTSAAPSLGSINNVPDGDYYIKNRGSGEYFNVSGALTSAGAQIIQYPYQAGATNEIFTLKHIGAGYYTITGKGSGLLATIAGTSLDDFAKLEQDGIGTLPSGAIGPADNQLWSFIPVDASNGDYLIQARHSGKVVDVNDGTSDTIQLQQYQVLNGTPQRWSLISAVQNLLSNPSFEADNSFTYSPTAWGVYSPSGDSDASYVETNGGGQDGSYHLTHYKSGNYTTQTYQDVTLANGTYAFSFWAKTNVPNGGSASVVGYLWDRNSGYVEVQVLGTAGLGGWTQFTTPALTISGGQAEVGFKSISIPGNNFSYFDTCSLTTSTAPTNLTAN